MKNVSSFLGKIAVTTVLASSLLAFNSCKDSASNNGATASTDTAADSKTLPIAYVNVDSLLVNYEYAKDVNERLTKKMEDVRVTINQKTKKLEKEMQEFQRKVDNNAFLSQDRAQQEYTRIQKQQQDLELTAQRLQNDWAMEQHKENMQIADSVRKCVEILNETEKYQIILNMRELDNIILANPDLDITTKVLTILNNRYKPEAKK